MRIQETVLLLLAFLSVASCQEAPSGPEQSQWESIEKRWSGGAEMSCFKLTQQRYGSLVEGESVFIFVREPFLKDRQVKDESGRGGSQVLKLNAMRNFQTGVYPYSTMVSVFQPLEEDSMGKTLKVTTSVQDWCGHVFVQTNRRDGTLRTEVKSYFEKEEGGVFEEKASVLLEDEVWTTLRINPSALPVGEVEMIPSSLSARFAHRNPVAESAQTRWLAGSSKKTVIYEITYPESERVLAIEIQKKLPYVIEAWRETGKKGLLSSGTLKKRVENVEYWNFKKDPEGAKLRKKLGLRN